MRIIQIVRIVPSRTEGATPNFFRIQIFSDRRKHRSVELQTVRMEHLESGDPQPELEALGMVEAKK
jgi:hypothetical protein